MTDRHDASKHVIELSRDDDDDDRPGPPAVRYAPIPRRRPSPAPRFRADPIDSLREPPMRLGDLLGELWSDLVAGARALDRTVAA